MRARSASVFEGRVEDVAADIFEDDVYPLRRGAAKLVGEVVDRLAAIVDRDVKTVSADDSRRIFRPRAGANADNLLEAPLSRGDLANQRTDAARRSGHEDDVTRLRLADVEIAEIGGHPDRAEHGDIVGRRRHPRRCR